MADAVQEIVTAVAKQFPSFGSAHPPNPMNPVAMALKDQRPMFAAGVDIEEVVKFILEHL